MIISSTSHHWNIFVMRSILPPLLTIALFIAAISLIIIPAIEKNSLDRKKEMIRELTTSAWNILAKFEHEEQAGLLTRDEAQRQAIEQIRTLHYGQQMREYFWINDMEPRMIIHPYRTDLNGRDMRDYTDAAGKPVFKEIVDVVKKYGAGYVEYMWQWGDDQKRIAPKISYVKGFAPWGWVLGTGIYIEDVRQEIASMTRNVISISLVIFLIMVCLLSFSVLQHYRTEKQRAAVQKALLDSEEKYRTIFETTGTATIIIDEDMTISLANSMFEELSGFSKSEVEGQMKFQDFAFKDDFEWMEGYHYARRVDPGSAPRNYEFRFIDRHGTIKHIMMTIAVIPQTQKSVASFLDITEHKLALQVRAESEERFRSLVENALTGIFIVQDDQIVYYNPEQERLFGPIPPGFTLTKFEKIYPEDVPKVRQFYQRIASGDAHTLDIDYRFYPMGSGRKPSGVRWAYCRASAIDYLGRKGILVNMMDVTRAKELERLIGIKDKMISLGHVAAGIAHEIRNPLSGINVFLDGIRENFRDPQSADDIDDLISQAQGAAGKIESVIRGVLDFARPSNPRFDLTDINLPITDAVRLSHVALRKSDIRIETDLQADLPPVQIDVQQIEQVILNLITNGAEALRNSDGQRRIAVQTRAELDMVTIRISDSGCGVPVESRDKIFDPFYTTKKDGSGIGLSICRRIVADHRGTITVAASHAGGAEFIIQLPAGAKG